MIPQNELYRLRRVRSHLVLCSILLSNLLISPEIAFNRTNQAQNQTKPDIQILEPGKPIKRELSGGESHLYQIHLDAGQFLHLIVEQKGIDVVVTAIYPDNHKIEVDSPNGAQGPEPVKVVAEESGSYHLKIESLEKEAPSGRYEVRIEEWREITEEDRMRVAFEMTCAEANRFFGQKTAQSWRKSIEKFTEALSIAQTAKNLEWEFKAHNSIAVLYSYLCEYQKALEHYQHAIQVNDFLGDSLKQSSILFSMGGVYLQLGETQRALDYFTQALLIDRQLKKPKNEVRALNTIGMIYRRIGELQKALDHYNQALDIIKVVEDKWGEGYTLSHIGQIYNQLGEQEKALDYHERALKLRLDYGDELGGIADLHSIGIIYLDLGEQLKALEYLNRTLEICHEKGSLVGESGVLLDLGRLHYVEGDKNKTLEYYNQALEISQNIGDRHGEGIMLSNIGKIYIDWGENQKAIDHFNQALPLIRASGDKKGEAMTLYGIARAELKLGNLLRSKSWIETGLGIIDSLRTKVTSYELRASYFASMREYYDFYIDLLMRQHQTQPSERYDLVALRVSERARARSLLETLTEASLQIRQGINPDLLEREQTLQQQLEAREQLRLKLLVRDDSKEQLAFIEKEIRSLIIQYQEIESDIRTSNPNYASLTQPELLSPKAIQDQVLDNHTMLLEYALCEDHSYAWLVTSDTVKSYVLPEREEIENASKKVCQLLIERNQIISSETREQKKLRIAKADSNLSNAMIKLSDMILAPIVTDLKTERLLVVAEGALQYVPFGALPKPIDQSDLKTELPIPLMAEYETLYLPSASVLPLLRELQKNRPEANKLVAVLADAVFSFDDPRVKRSNLLALQDGKSPADLMKDDIQELQFLRSMDESGLGNTRSKLSRLPFSRQEAEAIIALVHSKGFMKALDFNANYTTATSPELSNYRIVHFATHGLLNSTHPELSGLVLSLVDKEGNPQNGFLRLHDIYNLNLNADLVVLSACQTALGKDIRGEGLIGLTRGFMYAGAPRVVASLWKVDDEATAELMKRFYQFMLGEEQLPAAAALREAQISIMNEKRWQSPYYWAAFVLQGDWK